MVYDLDVIVAFLDNDENFLECIRSEEPLSPNKMWEIIVPKLESKFGVVKVISYKNEQVKPDIVGLQRHVLAIPSPTEVAFSEAPLAAVSTEYAQVEYSRIINNCP